MIYPMPPIRQAMNRVGRPWFASALIGALGCGHTFAGGPQAPAEPAPHSLLRFPLTVELSGRVEFLDTSAAGPSGRVLNTKLGFPIFIPINETWRVTGGLSAELRDYERAPFASGGLRTWSIGTFLSLNGKLSETWSASFGALGSLSFEDGADLGESFGGGILATAGYRWSKSLQTSLGALYLIRTDDDPLLVPAIGLEWQATDRLLFSIRGLEAMALYELSDTWEWFWRANVDLSGARLRARAGTQAANFDDDAFRTGLGASWRPDDSWKVTMEAGVTRHWLTVLDDENRELSKGHVTGPYVGLKVSAKF
jgi:hypothetical protein